MLAWKNASDVERSGLLEKLLGKEIAGSAKITDCMNAASAVPGHSDLPIAMVAKACASQADQPV